MYPKTTTYRVRVAWLDWLNETHWSDWFEIVGIAGEYQGSGVPPRVAALTKDGLVLDEHLRAPVHVGALVSGHSTGRYIPSHRITAVDWEEI